MKREKKMQIMALLILFMFIGSSVAIALISVVPIQKEREAELIYDKPLSNSEEAPFLQQNFVIVKFFWSKNCTVCHDAETALLQARKELNGKIVIEKIDIDKWREHAKALGIQNTPSFYLKGRTIKIINTTDPDQLIENICPLYFYYIDECALLV